MATKKQGSLASLTDVRNEVVSVYHDVKSGAINERMGRTLVQILSRTIYATNSIVRNHRTTGVPLSKGNLDWAA